MGSDERTYCWTDPLPVPDVVKASVRIGDNGNVKIAKDFELHACGQYIQFHSINIHYVT